MMTFLDLLKERLLNPVLGAFSVSWGLWNFPALLIIFSGSQNGPERIEQLSGYFDEAGASRFLWWPIASSLGYLYVFPLVVDVLLKIPRRIELDRTYKAALHAEELAQVRRFNGETQTSVALLLVEMKNVLPFLDQLPTYLQNARQHPGVRNPIALMNDLAVIRRRLDSIVNDGEKLRLPNAGKDAATHFSALAKGTPRPLVRIALDWRRLLGVANKIRSKFFKGRRPEDTDET